MNVKDFIIQLKSLKPGKRVEFLKQHLQDEFWLDVVKNKSYALQIFRFCCTSSDINTCVDVFDMLVQKGCFMRIIQKFDETHVINNNILSILKICPDLLSSWFSGPLKFETSDAFFTFLVYGSKYTGNLNLVGNIEQFLKYDTIKLFNFYSLQSALTQSRKYNKQTYNYILKLISEANADIIKSFNSNHKVEGDIIRFIINVPEICVLLKPPFIFDSITIFVNMMWSILVMYEKKPSDTYILKYFDDHVDGIQFMVDTMNPYVLKVHMAYYLSEYLNRNLDHLYGLLFSVICKNKKGVDELYAGAQYTMKQTPQQQYVIKGCERIIKDLESTFYNTDDNVTADDIKDLFDI